MITQKTKVQKEEDKKVWLWREMVILKNRQFLIKVPLPKDNKKIDQRHVNKDLWIAFLFQEIQDNCLKGDLVKKILN